MKLYKPEQLFFFYVPIRNTKNIYIDERHWKHIQHTLFTKTYTEKTDRHLLTKSLIQNNFNSYTFKELPNEFKKSYIEIS